MTKPLRWVELLGPDGPGKRPLWTATVGTDLVVQHAASSLRRGHGVRTLWLGDGTEEVGTLYGERGDANEERPATAEPDRKVALRPPRTLEVLAALGVDPPHESLEVLGKGAGEATAANPRLTTAPPEQRLIAVPDEPEWPDGGFHEKEKGKPDADDRMRIAVPACRLSAGTLRVRLAKPGASGNKAGKLLLGLGAVPESGGELALELDAQGVAFRAAVEPPTGGSKKVEGWFRLEPRGDDGLALRLLPERLDGPQRAAWLDVWGRLAARFLLTRATMWARLTAEPRPLPPALAVPLDENGVPLPRRGGGAQLGAVWLLPPERVACTLADQPTESQRLGPESLLRLVPGPPPRVERDGGGNLAVTLEAGPKPSPKPEPTLEYRWQRGGSPRESVELPGKVALGHDAAGLAARLRDAYGEAAGALREGDPVPAFLPERRGWIELLVTLRPASEAEPTTKPKTDGKTPPPTPVTSGFVTWGLRRAELQPAAGLAAEMAWSLTAEAPDGFRASFAFDNVGLTSAEVDLLKPGLLARGLLWAAAVPPDAGDALPRLDDAPGSLLDLPLASLAAEGEKASFELGQLVLEASPPLGAGEGWDDLTPAGRRPALKAGTLTIRKDLLAATVRVGTKDEERRARLWRRHPTLPAVQLVPMTRAQARDGSPLASRQLAAYELCPAVKDLVVTDLAKPLLRLAPDPKDADLVPVPGWPYGFPGVPLAAISLPGVLLVHAKEDASPRWGYRFDVPLLDEPLARAELPPTPGWPDAEVEETETEVQAEVVATAAVEPPATALDRRRLGELWGDRRDARSLVDTERALAFTGQPEAGTHKLEVLGVLEPWPWPAEVTLSAAVTGASGKLLLGAVTFRDPGTNTSWAPRTGDAALSGPSAIPGVQTLERKLELTFYDIPKRLLGWSVGDRRPTSVPGDLLVDGRGVAYALSPDVAGDRLRRRVLVESVVEGAGGTDALLTTRKPLALDAGGEEWRLAFADLPARKAGAGYELDRRLGPDPKDPEDAGRLAALRDGRSWRLDGGQGARPLRLYGFSFVPAELRAYKETAAGGALEAEIVGRLHLPRPGDGEAELVDNPVALRFTPGAAGLALSKITAETADQRLRFRLPRLEADRGAASILSAGVRLATVAGSGSTLHLHLDDPSLAIDLFGMPLAVPLGPTAIRPSAPNATLKWPPDGSDGDSRPDELALTRVELLLDLRDPGPGDTGARPDHKLTVTAEARIASERGVSLDLTWSYPPAQVGTGTEAKLTWLGNKLPITADRLVPSPRGLALTLAADPVDLVLLAGEKPAPCRLDGAVGLALAASFDANRFAFPLAAGWVELIVARGGLLLTHLAHLARPEGSKAAWVETFRLDGSWALESAIEWPALAPPDPMGDQRLRVEPPRAGAPGWAHGVTLHLSDHTLLLGEGRTAVAGPKLAGSVPGLTLAEPVELVTEVEHELKHPDGRRLAWRAVQRVTLASGAALAEALEEGASKTYTFTPTYRDKPGGGGDGDYAHAGIARLKRALAGLHDERLLAALKGHGPRLVIEAGQTVLLRERDAAGTASSGKLPLWSVLHLPCLAASPPMPPVEHGFAKAITVARHDALVGLEVAVDPGAARDPAALLRPPAEEAFPPLAGALGRAALPGRALAAALGPDGPRHVEQAHTGPEPGTPAFVRDAPPFPRALLALAAATDRLARAGERLEALSFLPAAEDARRDAEQRDWGRLLLPPRRGENGVADTAPADASDIDLVVGGPAGLARVAAEVPPYDGQAAWDRLAEAAAATATADPAFVIARGVEIKEQLGSRPALPRPAFEVARLRERGRLDRPAAPLRAATALAEPALGWPAAHGAGMTPPNPALLGSHLPFQDHAAGIAGIAGTVVPPCLDAAPFHLAADAKGEVAAVAPAWLAETSGPAFLRPEAAGPGAPATAGDGRGAARAFLPPLALLRQGLAQALGAAEEGQKAIDRLLQPVLPRAAARAEINARPGVLRALATRALAPNPGTPDAVGGALRASPGPATTRSHRTPRPVPLPPNDPAAPGRARRPWGWPGRPDASCLIRPDPSDILLPDAAGAGWAVLVAAEEPAAGRRVAGPWDGAVLLRFEIHLATPKPPEEAPALWLARQVLGPLVATPTPSDPSRIETPARARLRRGGAVVDYETISPRTLAPGSADIEGGLWCVGDPAGIVGVTRWWLRRAPGAARLEITAGERLGLELDLIPPKQAGAEALPPVVTLKPPMQGPSEALTPAGRRRLLFALRADPVGAYATALAARAVLFGDPAYDAALSAVPIKREVGLRPGPPERRLDLVVDRPACNPGDELVLAVTAAENAGTRYGLTVQRRSPGGEFAPVAVLSEAGVASLEPELGLKDVRILPLAALVLPGGRGDPLVLRPGDALRLTARPRPEIADARDLAVTVQLDVVAEPVLPLPEAAYGLLRVDADGGEAECPLYAGDPRAGRVEALDPAAGLAAGALARRGRFRWRHVVPAALPGGYFLLKADATGATHLPEDAGELVDR